jgi:hypothetical protein
MPSWVRSERCLRRAGPAGRRGLASYSNCRSKLSTSGCCSTRVACRECGRALRVPVRRAPAIRSLPLAGEGSVDRPVAGGLEKVLGGSWRVCPTRVDCRGPSQRKNPRGHQLEVCGSGYEQTRCRNAFAETGRAAATAQSGPRCRLESGDTAVAGCTVSASPGSEPIRSRMW